MPEKYQNRYRIKSARLEGYDYSQPGMYFITICTDKRKHYFGDIVDGKMQLSEIGVLADELWYSIKSHHKNIELHEFVVMPNHIHGILEIVDGGNGGDDDDNGGRDDARIVSTETENTVDNDKSNCINDARIVSKQMKKISPKSGSLGRIIGSYKSVVSKQAHRLGYEFEWQSRFYDHIIHNKIDYNRISKYVINNPQNWKDDKFNGKNNDD
ncbi:MAG: transposase [Bacteroidota bacterium]